MIDIERWNTIRKKNRITLEELSQKTEISISTLKDIFRGKTLSPRIDTVQAIERALGLAPAFTEEEKALGVGQAKTTLSEEEWAWLEQMEELKQKKGDVAVKVIMDMIRAYIEK